MQEETSWTPGIPVVTFSLEPTPVRGPVDCRLGEELSEEDLRRAAGGLTITGAPTSAGNCTVDNDIDVTLLQIPDTSPATV